VSGGIGNPGSSGPSNDNGTHAPMEDGVKDTSIDDARLAALLDGRLADAEREDLLARLSDSDEDYLVYADAAAILREREPASEVPAPELGADDGDMETFIAAPAIASTDDISPTPDISPAPDIAPTDEVGVVSEEAADARVIPIRSRRRIPIAAWGAIAAVLVGLALIPVLRSRGGDPYDPARLAARLQTPASSPDEPWTSNVFFLKRGAPEENIEDLHRAGRLGALLVDLELAVRAGDTAAIHASAQAAANAANVPGATFLVQMFDSIGSNADKPPAQLKLKLDEARQSTKESFDEAYLAAGAWSEAARLAAIAHDAEFFRKSDGREEVAKILALRELSGTARAEAEGVRAALPAEGAPNWAVLKDHLKSLVKALGA